MQSPAVLLQVGLELGTGLTSLLLSFLLQISLVPGLLLQLLGVIFSLPRNLRSFLISLLSVVSENLLQILREIKIFKVLGRKVLLVRREISERMRPNLVPSSSQPDSLSLYLSFLNFLVRRLGLPFAPHGLASTRASAKSPDFFYFAPPALTVRN